MKKLFLLLFSICLISSCMTNPVTTGDATEITTNSAVITGGAHIKGNIKSSTSIGVFVSQTPGIFPETSPAYEAMAFDENFNFSIPVDELEEGTTYYYCSYLYKNEEFNLGEVKSFTTKTTTVAECNSKWQFIKIGQEKELLISTNSDCVIAAESENPEIATISILNDSTLVVAAKSEGLVSMNVKFPETELFTAHTDLNIPLYVYNGETAADLGIDVLWAKYNVGAQKPEEFGKLFAWGECKAKESYLPTAYFDPKCSKYYEAGAFTVYGIQKLEEMDDVARVDWGGAWRMPLEEDIDSLLDDCEWSWTEVNGVKGYTVKGKKPGYENESIFLPAAGMETPWAIKRYGYFRTSAVDTVENNVPVGGYWSRRLDSESNTHAYLIFFDSSSHSKKVDVRSNGHSVRPIMTMSLIKEYYEKKESENK